jgi:cytidylate kinase
MKKGLVITIDGPSYIYLDTGALYRALAYQMLREEISPDDRDRLADLCRKTKIKLINVNSTMRVMLEGEDVTDMIRTEAIGLLASKISARSLVRETLFHVQRKAGENGGIVAEGRDMGTVIFPDADIKFFLEASVEERIQRRFKELTERNNDIDYLEVERDLIRRDRQDRERKVAPLIPSEDAVIIDSTNISVSEVVEKMISIIKSKEQ